MNHVSDEALIDQECALFAGLLDLPTITVGLLLDIDIIEQFWVWTVLGHEPEACELCQNYFVDDDEDDYLRSHYGEDDE